MKKNKGQTKKIGTASVSEPLVLTAQAEKKPSFIKRFARNTFPQKGDKPGDIVRKVIMMIAWATLLFCLVFMGIKGIEALRNYFAQNSFADMVEDGQYDKLYAINNDFVGWLEIKDSSVALPVVKSSDNSYYLRRDFYKKNTRYGNPFLDYRNKVDDFDFNTIIYGHNMEDKQIFGQLLNMYDTAEHAANYPLIQFNTLKKKYTWKVVGAFLTNAKDRQDNNYVFPFNMVTLSDGNKVKFLEQLEQRFIYNTQVGMETGDHLLMLSTCSETFTDARLIVVARLVRDGEPEKVDTSRYVMNENPRYPQAWYSKYKKTNPYKNEEQWRPSLLD